MFALLQSKKPNRILALEERNEPRSPETEVWAELMGNS